MIEHIPRREKLAHRSRHPRDSLFLSPYFSFTPLSLPLFPAQYLSNEEHLRATVHERRTRDEFNVVLPLRNFHPSLAAPSAHSERPSSPLSVRVAFLAIREKNVRSQTRRRRRQCDATWRGEFAGRTNASQGSSMTDVERGERTRAVVRVRSSRPPPSSPFLPLVICRSCALRGRSPLGVTTMRAII